MNNETIYTAAAVADKLNSHVKTINKLCRTGEMKGYKKLGRWVVLHSDLIDWIKGK